MKAVGYKESLPIENVKSLIDIEIDKPTLKERDILVKVEAVSVNPVDTKVRLRAASEDGEYKILGWDVAGVVEEVGSKVKLFKVGDKVWYAGAIDRPGANSEYHAVDERIVSKMPNTLSFKEAAALPLTTITAWEILFDRLRVQDDDKKSILVIGAAGGVGSILTQLVKKKTQHKLVATASREESKQWAKSLGADYVINHRKPLSEELKQINMEWVDYIIALTHTGDYLTEMEKIIAPQGKIAVIDDPPAFDIMPFKRKSVSIHWELMFTRSLFQTEDMIEQHKLLQTVADMIDRGEVKTTFDKDFGKINAENLRKAHALLESGKSMGKIVLSGF